MAANETQAKHHFGSTAPWAFVDGAAGAYVSQLGFALIRPNDAWKQIKLDEVTVDIKGFDVKEQDQSNASTLADLYKDGMTLYFVRHQPPDETLTSATIQNFGGTRTKVPVSKDDGGGTLTLTVLVTSDMWPLKFHVMWQYVKRDPRSGFSHVWDPRKVMAPALVAYTLSQDGRWIVRTDVYYGVMVSNVPLSALNMDVTSTAHPTIDITYTYIQHVTFRKPLKTPDAVFQELFNVITNQVPSADKLEPPYPVTLGGSQQG